jgi:DNA polymerase-3 subunit beta
MKTVIETKRLIAFLQSTNGVSKNASLPILEDVLLTFGKDSGTARVSNLEFNALLHFACSGDEFEVCVPKTILMQFLKSYKADTIVIEHNIDTLVTTFAGFSMQGHDVDEMPCVPEIDEARELVFSPVLNYEIIEASNYCGSDDLRPVMSGIFLNSSKGYHAVVATNSHILYKANLGACDEGFEHYEILLGEVKNLCAFIKGMKLLNEGVKVCFNGVNAKIVYSDCEVVLRLIDGRYPNFDAVIPIENNIRLKIAKNSLIDAINMVKPAISRSTSQVQLHKTETGVKVVGMDIDYSMYMECDVHADFVADECFQIAFNYKFFETCLKSCLTDEIELEMSAANRAGVINNYHRTILVMPVMLVKPEPETESEEGNEVDCETEEEFEEEVEG